jgi:fibronectin-binding autotransporter adhesin
MYHECGLLQFDMPGRSLLLGPAVSLEVVPIRHPHKSAEPDTDPKLGTFGYNGGTTQTIPLLSGSPAIAEGNPSSCTDVQGNLVKTDQRGMTRPDPGDTGGGDMGAYESQGG